MNEINHVIMFSGGVCSWAVAKRVVERHGKCGTVALFADTKIEDEDLYRFLEEAALNIGIPLVKIADGRTPWQVFEDVKAIGSSRIDPCSRILKREILDRWVSVNAPNAVLHFGLDWTEVNRLEKLRIKKSPRQVEAYMTQPPYIEKSGMLQQLKVAGIKIPRLYGMGFSHNNCGGFCVKAGQAQFEKLFRYMPDRYREHEEKEIKLRKKLGWRQTILRDRSGGETKSLTLKDFRLRLEAGNQFDHHDFGGCGCAVD